MLLHIEFPWFKLRFILAKEASEADGRIPLAGYLELGGRKLVEVYSFLPAVLLKRVWG